MKFSETEEFKKDFKRFNKKYLSLDSDLEVLKEYLIVVFEEENLRNSKHLNILQEIKKEYFINKSRMMCKYLKGTDFRVIFYFDLKAMSIIFLELYYKAEKENEDRERIITFLKSKVKS